MDTLLHELRCALRMAWRSPGTVGAAVLCLAVSIGANTAVFSLASAALLRGLPYREPERIFIIWNQFLGEDLPEEGFSVPEFLDLRERTTSFAEVAAARPGLFNVTGSGDPELLIGARVSPALFRLLGVRPSRGRWFLPEEEQPGHERVVILSHELWRRRFGSGPGVVGRKLVIDGQPFTVVGVTPSGFYFRRKGRDLWMPLAIDRAALPARDNRWFEVYGRLKPGVTQERARGELAAAARRLAQDYPAAYPAKSGYGMTLVSYRETVIGGIRPALLLLAGAVGLVLLIACANVANLLLARATTRDREVALRAALGAGRGALVRQFLAESLVLAAAGGAVGLLLAWWGVRAAAKVNLAQIPSISEVSIDWRVLLFTAVISLASGVLFGLAPALAASRTDFHQALKQGGRGAAGAGRHLARRLLVVLEVAVALVVLVGAGLMIRSFRQLERIDPGFDPHRVLTFELFLPQTKYPDKAQWVAFFAQLLERARAIPGVLSAGEVNAVPLGKVVQTGDLVVEGLTLAAGQPSPSVGWRTCSPDYFKTLGIPLLAGRFFAASDDDRSVPVAIVDQGLVERYWPGQGPIGKRLKLSGQDSAGEWRTVVGVVGKVKHLGLEVSSPDQVYVPARQFPQIFMYGVLKTAGDPALLTPAVRRAVREVDRDQAIFRVETMEQKVADNTAWRRFHTLLLGIFGVVALILAGVGVYGVTAFSVAQRRREIGIRMALGARRPAVVGLVVGQALALAGCGLAVGLAAALGLTQVVKKLLFGVDPIDPVTFGGVALLLALLVLLASYLPARKASRTDPVAALAAE